MSGRRVQLTPEQHQLTMRRTQHLLSPQALAMAQNNLHVLLAMAYSQGADDAVTVLANAGVDLDGALSTGPETTTPRPKSRR
jgi:hypothetical protein